MLRSPGQNFPPVPHTCTDLVDLFMSEIVGGPGRHVIISVDQINRNLRLFPRVEQENGATETILGFALNELPTSATKLFIAQRVADAALNITFAHLMFGAIAGEPRQYIVSNAFHTKTITAVNPVSAFFKFLDVMRVPTIPNSQQNENTSEKLYPYIICHS